DRQGQHHTVLFKAFAGMGGLHQHIGVQNVNLDHLILSFMTVRMDFFYSISAFLCIYKQNSVKLQLKISSQKSLLLLRNLLYNNWERLNKSLFQEDQNAKENRHSQSAYHRFRPHYHRPGL